MVISVRHLILGLSVVVFLLGAVLWIFVDSKILGVVAMGCGLLSGLLTYLFMRSTNKAGQCEPIEMNELPQERRHELLRGTSHHLNQIKYRYSVRIDHNETAERCCFNADVNSIKLGFVPVVITDNATDKQGFGYAAFVFDGNRWLGPGLPCPGTKEQAIAHAQKSVAPPEDDATEQ